MAKAPKPEPHDITAEDRELFMSVCQLVIARGFVSAEDLTTQYGAEATTKAIAVLYRTHRMMREVRRPGEGGNVLGYEWADRRFSKAEMAKIPPGLLFIIEQFAKPSKRYTDFVQITAHCKSLNGMLGAMPVKREDADTVNSFDRLNGTESDIFIPRYCLRAMLRKALQIMGQEMSLADRIVFSTLTFPAGTVSKDIAVRPVPPAMSGQPSQGRGMQLHEKIPGGVTFDIRAMVPTSVINPDQYLGVLRCAGEFVGLSPARSAGFGNFEVVGAE